MHPYSARSSVNPAHRGRHARNPERLRTDLAILVVLLASACLSCFGAAYYLFTTRWDTRALNLIREQANQEIQVVPFKLDSDFNAFSHDYEPHERFLAYLPHSGFHNQRIALENALVLSRLLNRTLLVPPIRLGNKPLRYVNFDALRQFVALSGKEGLFHCSKLPVHMSFPSECFDYFDYTHIAWEWVVNLTEVKSQQRLIQRWNMTDGWIHESLRIPETDILTLRDSNPYHFRFLDTLADISPSKDKYIEAIYIPKLALSSKRLIQIGTLFGSSRLRLKNVNSTFVRGMIRQSTTFASSHLLRAANSIEVALGSSYLGAHIRLGDGHFMANGQINARLVWWKLVHEVLEFDVEETAVLERILREPKVKLTSKATDIPGFRQLREHPLSKELLPHFSCRGHRHTHPHLMLLNTPLFISTDVVDPLADPSLMWFHRTFPCTFFLSDFSAHTEALGRLQNGYDGVMLKDFLLPFLDAIVVGKAWKVVGTEGSTFSRFVQDVLWRTYHGLDIVQRGWMRSRNYKECSPFPRQRINFIDSSMC